MAYGLLGRSLIDGKVRGRWRMHWHWGDLLTLVAALLCCVSPVVAAGGAVQYSYDALGRLTQVKYATGVIVTYTLDAAGNRTSVTTTQPPAAPGTPTISLITGSTATATWTAPSGATGYQYSLNGGANWTPTGATSASLSGLAVGTQYTIAVQACDAAGGCGPQSSASFTTAPSAPGAVAITNITTTSATVSWGPSTDSVGVSYEYLLNPGGGWTSVGGSPSINLTGLTAGTQYAFSVRAYDAAGTRGPSSSGSFTTVPILSTPTGLSATVAGNTQINLSWSASSDTGGPGVAGYQVYRNGSEIGTAASTFFSDTGVSPFNTYSYTVVAYDTQGHTSGQSSVASASTYFTITNSSGAVLSSASSLYSETTSTMNPHGGATIYQWNISEVVGSGVSAADTVNSTPPGCGSGATVRLVASGYQLSGCVLTAEPSVYGH